MSKFGTQFLLPYHILSMLCRARQALLKYSILFGEVRIHSDENHPWLKAEEAARPPASLPTPRDGHAAQRRSAEGKAGRRRKCGARTPAAVN